LDGHHLVFLHEITLGIVRCRTLTAVPVATSMAGLGTPSMMRVSSCSEGAAHHGSVAAHSPPTIPPAP
jgi:hypothetical protein